MIPSLYIHIPFCRKRCLYCNFYSEVYDEPSALDYIDILSIHMNRLEDRKFSTIYIGGGTPTVLGENLLAKLLDSIEEFKIENAEFSIEANPESLNIALLELFLNKGVNRLSIGVQSFDDGKLKKLGRIHSARAAQDAIQLARRVGFKNISIDLIFGVYGEDLCGWKEELRQAVSLPITHLSAYGLSYEDDTPLSDMLKKNKIEALSDIVVAEMYDYTIDYLSQYNYDHYEVSNFAKKGYRCKHNLNYWQNNSYIGLGASAVSYTNGERKENISDVKEYISKAKKEEKLVVSTEQLSLIDRAKETAALKIRTNEGIDSEWFREKTGFDFWELENSALEKLLNAGLIKKTKESASLTKKGYLFCDTISSSLL